jgi:hypothetical protein
MEGNVAVVAGDVAMGSSPAAAHRAIRMMVLINDVSLPGRGYRLYFSGIIEEWCDVISHLSCSNS